MTRLEVQLKALDSAYWELGESLHGFPEEDLWTRPHPRLLSVGELLAHIGLGLGKNTFGDDFASPFNLQPARYYLHNVVQPFTLPMSSQELYGEVGRILEEVKAFMNASQLDLDSTSPHREDWTWGYTLEYQAFHIAYHTGQIYSARHLMGHETEDN